LVLDVGVSDVRVGFRFFEAFYQEADWINMLT